MRNDERDVASVLQEAVEAAAGTLPEKASGEWLRLDGEDPAGAGGQAGRIGGGEQEAEEARAAESGLGLGTSGTGWNPIGMLAPQASSRSTLTKVVSWINPLAGGLMSILGKRESEPAIALPKAVRPAGIRYEAGIGGGSGEMVRVDRDERGQLRSAEAMPSVVVKVEAMDSRSFLDRTPEIAEAVKRALLESEGLGRLMNRD
jgi:hypothetical protein